jgi:hypothetical protein
MRRRGLERPPGYPGPGPQPGNSAVISVPLAPDRPNRPDLRTIRTHRTIWLLPGMLPRVAIAGVCLASRKRPHAGTQARLPARAATDGRRGRSRRECMKDSTDGLAAEFPQKQERRGSRSLAADACESSNPRARPAHERTSASASIRERGHSSRPWATLRGGEIAWLAQEIRAILS